MKSVTYALIAIPLVVGDTLHAAAQPRGDPPSERSVRAYVTNFGGDGVSVIDPVAGRLVANVPTGEKPIARRQLSINTREHN